jgi:hypothetical protein
MNDAQEPVGPEPDLVMPGPGKHHDRSQIRTRMPVQQFAKLAHSDITNS